MIKIGVLGAGEHFREQHAPALAYLRQRDPARLELSAVCDIRPERARACAEQFGFRRAYASLDEMLDGESLDAMLLMTKAAVTCEAAQRLLPTRMPLLIEKPPGVFPSDTQRLMELAERHSSPHMVSFNRRFDPAVMRARQWLAESAKGRPILQVVARMLRVHRREERFIADTGIHLVDAVLSFMPPAKAVSSRRWQSVVPGAPRGGDSADGRVEFADGSTAVMIFAPDCGLKEETYELIGSEYNVRIDATIGQAGHWVRVFDRGQSVLDWRSADDAPRHVGEGTLAEMERFLDAIEGREPYWPTLADGWQSMRVAHALHAGGETTL